MKKTISLFLSFLLVPVFLITCAATQSPLETDAAPAVNVNTAMDVNAKAYALMDINTGTLLAAGNEHERLYPASVTKIMTLLLVCEAIQEGRLSFEETLVCSDTAAAKGGSQIWLKQGEEMTVKNLLKAAAVYSANDACALLAEAVAGSEEAFVGLMNERARSLGMEDTHFDNCTGLDDDTTTHLTSAYDVAIMSAQLLKIDFITDFTTIWMDDLRDGKTQIVNTNRLIRFYPGATGLKTGTTGKAGCCVSATAERDGFGLIAVVLGAANSNDRFNGARTLLDYGYAHYEVFTPSFNAAQIAPVPVTHGEGECVYAQQETYADILLEKGTGARLQQTVETADILEAPVEKGQKIGIVTYTLDGKPIAAFDLTAQTDIPKLTFSAAFLRVFRSLKKQIVQ